MPEIKRKTLFEIGDILFLDTDPEQLERMVVAFYISFDSILYILRAGDCDETQHSAIEISKAKRAKTI